MQPACAETNCCWMRIFAKPWRRNTSGAVRRAEGLKCCADRRAFAESVEWERLGDFFLRIGSHPSAVRAYRDAALACLDGDYYDHGTEMLPCRFLRLRFLRMAETATACCAGDARLRAMLADDPLFREGYPLLKAGV